MFKGIEALAFLKTELRGNRLLLNDSNGKKFSVHFEFYPAAAKENINAIEAILGTRFPLSYIAFLLKYNGGIIYDYEGIDGFKIYGTPDLLSINEKVKEIYGDDWRDSIVIFSKYIGEGNYLGFKTESGKDEYPIIDCNHEEEPVSWLTIEKSFDNWLYNCILHDGNKYWLKK